MKITATRAVCVMASSRLTRSAVVVGVGTQRGYAPGVGGGGGTWYAGGCCGGGGGGTSGSTVAAVHV